MCLEFAESFNNFASYDISGHLLLHRLAETEPVSLCNTDMEISAIS